MRSVTRRYAFAVVLIAATVVTCGWITSVAGLHQESNAGIINVAGAQRMLSQRIAALVEPAGRPDGEMARTEMMTAVTRMDRANIALTDGPNAAARRTPELAAYYFEGLEPLDLIVRRFIGRARELDLSINIGGWSATEAGKLRTEALGLLLSRLQTAVQLHEVAATSDAREVLVIEWLVVCFTLVVLGIEVMLIFRPLAKNMRQLAESLETRGNIDELTGLLNRRAVTAALRDIAFTMQPLAVIAIDLDWFKEINEAEGHAGGDAVLREVAQRLVASVRQGDIVGRLGGDEFIAILIGMDDPLAAEAAARRICAKLAEGVSYNTRSLRVGATLGLAMCPADASTPEMVMLAADDALVREKHDRRGGIGRATPVDTARIMRDAAIMRKLVESDLALPGLEAYFQPLVVLSPTDGEPEIVAYEALARWHDPELGSVSPAEMFDAAERAGRFTWLTAQVRQSALAAFAALRIDGLPAPRLALNISAAEVTRGGIAAIILRDAARVGLTLSDLTLEITEDLLLDRVSDRALGDLAALRRDGARMSLDDFGAGSSGLSHLLRLGLDEVKIDKTFIQSIESNPKSADIIQAAVALGQSLGFDIVAEGIETKEQSQRLQDLGCTIFQGFLFARPMSDTNLRQWLKSREGSAYTKPLELRVV